MGEDRDEKEPEPKIVPGEYLTHDGHFIAERDKRPSKKTVGSMSADTAEGHAVVIMKSTSICLFVPQPTF